MKKLTVTIDGKAYPCGPTMGAMLRFRQETGREISQMDPASLTDLFTYFWCCVKSACAREGVEFGMSVMEFADLVNPDEMGEWQAGLMEEAKAQTADESETSDGEKKRP